MSFVDGSIKKHLYYNEENSYSVIKIKIINTDESELIYFEPTIVVCGFFPKLDVKSNYRFYGKVTLHQKYGKQYNADSFEMIIDNSFMGLVDYLSSNLFKGIGKKTAEKIVEKLGLNALDLIAENKNVLDGIPRINSHLKNVIYNQIINNRDMETQLVWLYGFEISPKMAMKIYSAYGNETINVIKENPYVLIDTVEGIGFRRADEIGRKVGFLPESPLRISAVIYFLLNEYMNKYGDTFIERERLVDFTIKYLNRDDFYIDKLLIDERIEYLISIGKITEKNHNLSLSFLYNSEKYISSKIMTFNNKKTNQYHDIDIYIKDYMKANNINYTSAQKKAIKKALNNQFVIITGGPGTGKTTVIKGICDIYLSLHNNPDPIDYIALAAPTGKAAKRLSKATGLMATTIHKLLGYDYQGLYNVDENNPLNVKLLIIDEVSMMDCLLGRRLLSGVTSSTQIVFVGDPNQLPSVGAGNVLNDLIKSDLFNVVELDIIHRQADDSNIIKLAYDILNKEINRTIFDTFSDRLFIRTNDRFVGDSILLSIKKLINQGYNFLEDIQVLIPIYKGINGIDRINELIQKTFNYKNKDFSVNYQEKSFWINDKVMQLTNQPEDGIMNGDQGVISGITEDNELLVNFSNKIIKYNPKELEKLTLAYAISIHKSQGSEYKCVILPLVKSYSIMLKRKLLYTAVTRAKEKLIMIGDFEAYKRGVLGMDSPRKTLLKDFLLEEINLPNKKELTIEDFL